MSDASPPLSGNDADTATAPATAGVTADSRERFVAYLRDLATRGDLATLATLRRGLKMTPDALIPCFPYVVPWVPASLSEPAQNARINEYVLVAGLFSLYPDAPRQGYGPGRATNLGATLRLVNNAAPGAGVERRFAAVLTTARENLGLPLRFAIHQAAKYHLPVDWVQLLRDVGAWERESRRVQRAWALAFWSSTSGRAPGARRRDEV